MADLLPDQWGRIQGVLMVQDHTGGKSLVAGDGLATRIGIATEAEADGAYISNSEIGDFAPGQFVPILWHQKNPGEGPRREDPNSVATSIREGSEGADEGTSYDRKNDKDRELVLPIALNVTPSFRVPKFDFKNPQKADSCATPIIRTNELDPSRIESSGLLSDCIQISSKDDKSHAAVHLYSEEDERIGHVLIGRVDALWDHALTHVNKLAKEGDQRAGQWLGLKEESLFGLPGERGDPLAFQDLPGAINFPATQDASLLGGADGRFTLGYMFRDEGTGFWRPIVPATAKIGEDTPGDGGDGDDEDDENDGPGTDEQLHPEDYRFPPKKKTGNGADPGQPQAPGGRSYPEGGSGLSDNDPSDVAEDEELYPPGGAVPGEDSSDPYPCWVRDPFGRWLPLERPDIPVDTPLTNPYTREVRVPNEARYADFGFATASFDSEWVDSGVRSTLANPGRRAPDREFRGARAVASAAPGTMASLSAPGSGRGAVQPQRPFAYTNTMDMRVRLGGGIYAPGAPLVPQGGIGLIDPKHFNPNTTYNQIATFYADKINQLISLVAELAPFDKSVVSGRGLHMSNQMRLPNPEEFRMGDLVTVRDILHTLIPDPQNSYKGKWSRITPDAVPSRVLGRGVASEDIVTYFNDGRRGDDFEDMPFLGFKWQANRFEAKGDVFVTGGLEVTRNLVLKSDTQYRGEFDHVLSANRVWTLPDQTVTLVGRGSLSPYYATLADANGNLYSSDFWDNGDVIVVGDSRDTVSIVTNGVGSIGLAPGGEVNLELDNYGVQLSKGWRPSVNREAISGNKTIALGDPAIQSLDPGTSDRDVNLPSVTAAQTDSRTIINRSTTNILTIKNSSGGTITTVDSAVSATVASAVTVIFDGSAWQVAGRS